MSRSAPSRALPTDAEEQRTSPLFSPNLSFFSSLFGMDSTVSTTEASVTTGYPHHDEYKDSGVDWLGEIPGHWYTTKLKFLCNESAVYGANRSADEYAEDGVRFLRTTDIDEGGQLRSDGVYIDPDSVEEYMLDDGDLLLSRSGTVGRSFVYSSSEHEPAAYAGYLVRFVLDEKKLNSKYAFYFTKSGNFDEWLQSNSIESTIGNVSGDKYANMAVAVPPLDEQRAIAAYLDRETERIDELIEKKERLIDLLEEKRKSLISRVVTKGLDRDVKLQDSGVDWLGKIPAHWEVVKLNHVTDAITNGYVGATSDILREDGVRYLQSTHIKDGDIVFDHDPYYVEKEWSEARAKSVLEEGWVLIVQTGDVGQCAAVTEEFVGANCHALIIAKPRGHLNGFWLSYFLRSRVGQALMLSTQTGATLKHLGCTEIKDMNILLPPLDEQQKIVEYLDEQEARIDALVEKVEVAIERLKEYRTALISAAVTGQIDVREEFGTAPVG